MGKAKPTLGYPSRTACAVALHNQGVHYTEIGRRMGVRPATAAALISGAKQKRPSVDGQKTVCVDDDVLAALRPAAIRRGITVNALCRQLLACIAEDDLADAILDDALEIAV